MTTANTVVPQRHTLWNHPMASVLVALTMGSLALAIVASIASTNSRVSNAEPVVFFPPVVIPSTVTVTVALSATVTPTATATPTASPTPTATPTASPTAEPSAEINWTVFTDGGSTRYRAYSSVAGSIPFPKGMGMQIQCDFETRIALSDKDGNWTHVPIGPGEAWDRDLYGLRTVKVPLGCVIFLRGP